MGGGAGYEGHRTPRGNATPVLGREVIYRLDVITCIAVKEAARRPAMYRIGSYQYVFRPCYPPGEPRRLDTWSECTADVQSARLGPDGISREYRRGRSEIPVSRRYLRNVARCTVERPSKRPSSYMPKLSNIGGFSNTWSATVCSRYKRQLIQLKMSKKWPTWSGMDDSRPIFSCKRFSYGALLYFAMLGRRHVCPKTHWTTKSRVHRESEVRATANEIR